MSEVVLVVTIVDTFEVHVEVLSFESSSMHIVDTVVPKMGVVNEKVVHDWLG